MFFPITTSSGMTITGDLFEAHLKCPLKCWFKARGETGTGNIYFEWVEKRAMAHRAKGIERLFATTSETQRAISPQKEALKTAKWRLAADASVSAGNAESRLHAVERIPSESRGKPVRFIPVRFVFANKPAKDDKLLLGFDALALSKSLGRKISLGKIVHGNDFSTANVKTPALIAAAQRKVEEITAMLAGAAPPDLALNRHCAECEFQKRCCEKAIEIEDLSLLAGMSPKERAKLQRRGIFSVIQLAYTFRPRRRPKCMRHKAEKYHHALKALAIRKRKSTS